MEIPIGKTILVVEDMTERIDWLKGKLISNRVFFRNTPKDAIRTLAAIASHLDIVFLDFDLGETENARAVADYLKEISFAGQVVIHSMNPVGAIEMMKILPFARKITYAGLQQMWGD